MSGSGGPLVFPACDSDTRVLGSEAFTVDQVTITTGVAQVLIPTQTNKRYSIAIRNHNPIGGSTLYIAETAAKATTALGWPILPQAGITITIGEGVTIYAVGDTASVDVRLAETEE